MNELLQWAAIAALAVAGFGVLKLQTNPIVAVLRMVGSAIETAVNFLGGRKP